jgi:hypothetical protein
MQNRIDRLEGLVLSLMTNGSQSAGPAAASAAIAGVGTGSSISGSSPGFPRDVDSIQEEPEGNESEVDQVTKSIGIMKVDSGRNIFASEAHWYSILAEVSICAVVGRMDNANLVLDIGSQDLLPRPQEAV